MIQITTEELEKLGRDAAEQIVSADAVEQVEVESGVDVLDRPAYHFTFLIDPVRAGKGPGLIRTRLVQKLRDEVASRDDPHRVVLRVLDRTDWPRRKGA